MKRLAIAQAAQSTIPAPPADRGALLTDTEVARLLKLEDPESKATRRWVREHVPNKKPIGYNTVRWFEADVLTWVASLSAA